MPLDLILNSISPLDFNGELVCHLTSDGTSGGSALCASYKAVGVIGFDSSGNALQAPHGFGKGWTNSNKTLTVKATRGTSTGVLIGGTVNSAQFVGSGYTLEVTIVCVKN